MANTPTNQVWDVKNKDFPSQISHTFNDFAISLYTKESGYYSVLESQTGITIFPEDQGGKQPLRKFFQTAVLPDFAPDTILTIPHGANPITVTRLDGIANDIVAPLHLPIPYATATAADVIEMYADDTNIYIVVGKDMSAFTAYVCFEYLEY